MAAPQGMVVFLREAGGGGFFLVPKLLLRKVPGSKFKVQSQEQGQA
jgi:hypothetical protein